VEILHFDQISDDAAIVRLSGRWKTGPQLPSASELSGHLDQTPATRRLSFDTQGLTEWDTGLLSFLNSVMRECSARKIDVDRSGLAAGVRRLLDLAMAVPEKKDAHRSTKSESFLSRVGSETIAFIQSAGEMVAFVGAACTALGRLLLRRAGFRTDEFKLLVQESGAQALPIVSLISFLVGLILAFIGILQLKLFGAQIYVADLVGIAMVREMGAIMTGIIIAGRTGAAFAAQLGTMQVNEEIDALTTLGISPMAFLVLPRMVSLTLMMPLLCLYANFMGILGGMMVAAGLYGIKPVSYFQRTAEAVGLNDLAIGLFMSIVFGILISLAGCMRGMQCGRSASAVGSATTSAVVTSIVAIIMATAMITVVCDVIGI